MDWIFWSHFVKVETWALNVRTTTVHWLLRATTATIPVKYYKVLQRGHESDRKLRINRRWNIMWFWPPYCLTLWERTKVPHYNLSSRPSGKKSTGGSHRSKHWSLAIRKCRTLQDTREGSNSCSQNHTVQNAQWQLTEQFTEIVF